MTENHKRVRIHTKHVKLQKKGIARISLHADNHDILTPIEFDKNNMTVITSFDNRFVKTSFHEQRRGSHVMIISNRGDQNN